MSDSNNGRHSEKVFIHDPQHSATRRIPAITPFLQTNEETLKESKHFPFISDDETIQVKIRIPVSENTPPSALIDDAATTVIDRQALFNEAATLEQNRRQSPPPAPQSNERTVEHPSITDYLPPDIRRTVATPAIGQQTVADQAVVQLGSWREFIVEVDDQLCLVVPIEIARSGLLRPGKRLVARIRSLDE